MSDTIDAPDADAAEAPAPEAAAPDVAAPEAAAPDAAASDEAGPDAAAPEEAGPDTAAPEEAGPDAAAPEEAAPDAAAPDTAAPDEAAPDAAAPDTAAPDEAAPEAAAPDEAAPEAAAPDLAPEAVAADGDAAGDSGGGEPADSNPHDDYVRNTFGVDPATYAAPVEADAGGDAGQDAPAGDGSQEDGAGDDGGPAPDADGAEDSADDQTDDGASAPDADDAGDPANDGAPADDAGQDEDDAADLPSEDGRGEDGDDTGEPAGDDGQDGGDGQDADGEPAADSGTDSQPAAEEAEAGRSNGPGGAAADAGQPGIKRPVIGPEQLKRATDRINSLSPEDSAKMQKTLAAAKSPEEADYLAKAVAAGHSPEEVEALRKEISGKSADWMDKNLHLVGASSGKGIKQQWSFSCGATETEAVMGELDPAYALKMRKDNPHLTDADDADGNKVNPQMANDQAGLLEGAGGHATSRNDPDHSGRGAKMNEMLNNQASPAGVSFDRHDVGVDASMDQTLDSMQQKLKAGMPVPIMTGNDSSATGHAAMVTAVDDGPPRRFGIHDPWTGSTTVYSEDDIRNGKLKLGDCNKIKSFYPPTQK